MAPNLGNAAPAPYRSNKKLGPNRQTGIIPPCLLGLGLGIIIGIMIVLHLQTCPDWHTVHVKNDVSKWDTKQLPIMKSLSRGFRPVYVYSKATPDFMAQYSQERQDELILALTSANDATQNLSGKGRFFVDLAANDALILSNTYLLERNGWDGLCIEANPEYWYRLASFRNCTIIGAAVGGNEDGAEVEFSFRGVFGGVVSDGLDNAGEIGVKRNLVSISTIFNQTNVPYVIDYMSLDVEGAESLVMEHFPWDYFSIKFLTIERPKEDLRQRLMLEGYKMIITLTNYGETLWIHQPSVLLSHEEIWRIARKYNNSHFTLAPDI